MNLNRNCKFCGYSGSVEWKWSVLKKEHKPVDYTTTMDAVATTQEKRVLVCRCNVCFSEWEDLVNDNH